MSSGEIIQAIETIGAGLGWAWACGRMVGWLRTKAVRADLKRANAVAADLRLRILRRCVADPEAVGHDLPTRRRVHTTAVLAETPIRDTALLARFAWVAPDILTGCSDQISAWSASQKGHFATRFMAFIRGALRG